MRGRLEKVDLSCTYSRVKIIGTLLCVLGAFTMSIMQSISTPVPVTEGTAQLSSPTPVVMFDRDKLIGCLYLLAAVLILSSTVVLQVTFFLFINQIVGKETQTGYIKVSLLNKNIVVFLQAFTLGEFPAPISLCAITSFFGGFMTTTAQLIEDHEFKTGWPLVSAGDMIGYSLLVISTSLLFTY